MKALDTNVLVRFLVDDDPRQTRRVRKAIHKAIEEDHELFIPDIVLAETVWVLARNYRFSRIEIAEVLNKLLATRQLRFDSTDRVVRALSSFRTNPGGFSDYLIREQAREAGCDIVLTFDKDLLKEPEFEEPL
jgi:predicted nucleic-acid-binding protein